jgi:DNA-binding LacI/PurR family transcriptional regulator
MHNLDVLIQKQVDSFLITSVEFDGYMKFYERIDELSNNFEKKDKYFCFINNCIDNGRISKVFGDDLLGGKMATEHLCELGHRNIALITGRYKANKTVDNTDFWSLRNEGYKSVLEKYGITFNPNNIFAWPEDKAEGGYYSAKKILELTPRPTAVFAGNDTYAIGAISAFHEAGLKLPEDISVVGLDGIDEGQIIYPKLTTVSLQREELGRIAVDHLVKRINHESNAQDIIVKPTLKIGQSTARPMLL